MTNKPGSSWLMGGVVENNIRGDGERKISFFVSLQFSLDQFRSANQCSVPSHEQRHFSHRCNEKVVFGDRQAGTPQ